MARILSEIHNALAGQIAACVQRPVNVYPFDPGPGGRQYPCITIDPGDPWTTYHETMGDNAVGVLRLVVRVHILANEIDQRIAIADFASDGDGAASSIRAAIESDPTWGGTVASSVVYHCNAPIPGDQLDVLTAGFDVFAVGHRG